MNEENKNEQNNEPAKYQKKTYVFIAIGLIAAGAVALGLSFTKLGIYSLIASMLFEIAGITFVNLQQKKNDLTWLLYVKIVAYALFVAALLLFAGGTIWASQKD